MDSRCLGIYGLDACYVDSMGEVIGGSSVTCLLQVVENKVGKLP